MNIRIFFLCKIVFVLVFTCLSCKKGFLNVKPSSSIVQPITLDNVEGLLNNDIISFTTSALAISSGEEFDFINYAAWQSLQTATERNAFIWNKDLFEGEAKIKDWIDPYSAIFYANNAIATLDKVGAKENNRKRWSFLKGWALFIRAYNNFNLVSNFAKAYDSETAENDLGIPIRITPDIDVIEQRASLKNSYDHIMSDLNFAINLLRPLANAPNEKSNRPSVAAVFALQARIYLSMRDYKLAEMAADSSLNIYSKLIDYRKVIIPNSYPFDRVNDEILYFSGTTVSFASTTINLNNFFTYLENSFLDIYSEGDLRLKIYFTSFNGRQIMNGNYGGRRYRYPFTGIATDEIYLIKAECAARRADVIKSMEFLNKLLINRISTEFFVPLDAKTSEQALDLVLLERRKELVWRGLRWGDLKRLNKEGANIKLERILNGVTYSLFPNDSRYVFPIPDDEIALSKILQNQR